MKIKDKTRVAEFICPGRPLYKAWLSWSLWVGSGLWVIYSFKWTKRFYHYKELNYFAKWYMYSIKTALIREWLFKLQSWCKMNCVQWSSICPFSLAMHDLLQQCTHLWDNIKPHLKSKGMLMLTTFPFPGTKLRYSEKITIQTVREFSFKSSFSKTFN